MKVLFDTNAVLYFLSDKNAKVINTEIVISFITELELLSYPQISNKEKKIIKEFLNNIDIIDINKEIKTATIDFRKQYNLKLPDAIICATAYTQNISLITNDKAIFRVKECCIKTYMEFLESQNNNFN